MEQAGKSLNFHDCLPRNSQQPRGFARLPPCSPGPAAELFSVLPHNRRRRFDANTDPSPFVNVRTFSRNPPNHVLSRQNRCHSVA
jgi:hypothetical protein